MMARVLTYTQYVNYFKGICEGHKLLNPTNTGGASHFYEFEEDFAGTKLKPVSFVLLPPGLGLKDEMSDNVMKEFNCEFWVLKSVKRENKVERLSALDECEAIGWDVIKRIKKHNSDYSLGINRPVLHFDLNSVRWEQISPRHSDNFYGYSFEFPFANRIEMPEVAANWW